MKVKIREKQGEINFYDQFKKISVLSKFTAKQKQPNVIPVFKLQVY